MNHVTTELPHNVAATPAQPDGARALRIAIFANIRLPAKTAAARRVLLIAEEMARQGQAVTLYMPVPLEPLGEKDHLPGVTYCWGAFPDDFSQWRGRNGRVKPVHQLRGRYRWLRQALRATHAGEHDWVYCYQPGIESAILCHAAHKAGRGVCIEQVDAYHPLYTVGSPLQRLYYRALGMGSDMCKCVANLLIVICSTLETECRESCPHVPLLRIPSLVDCRAFASGNPATWRDRPELRDRRLVVYAGALHNESGLALLFAAMRQVIQHVPDALFAFAGPPPVQGPAPEEMPHLHGIPDHARYLGLLNYTEIVDLLAAADLLVMPKNTSATNEAGFPTKLAEYLASGHPVVATTISDVADFLTDGEHAMLCPPGDPDALADAILRILQDPGSARIGDGGRLAAETHFDITTNIARILDAMRRTLPPPK